MKVFGSFGRRTTEDHLGAYATTCAYFLMISFVPFFMIFIAFSQRANVDITALTDGIIAIIPSGLKEYVMTIITEVQSKSYAYLPISVIILIWSAAKVFHALTNGLNVISKTPETRGWLYLRLRSMMYVCIFFACVAVALFISFKSKRIQEIAMTTPWFDDLISFLYSFRVLFAYFGLILVFLFIYKFLPNCRYTFRSQLPGALITSTVWVFFSYLMSLYYEHNRNFSNIYGSMTGVVLAMIWLYFCMWFVLLGAELNRVLYEDPDQNFMVEAVDVMRDANVKKRREIENNLDEHSIWRPLRDDDVETEDRQPEDIDIPWEQKTEEAGSGGDQASAGASPGTETASEEETSSGAETVSGAEKTAAEGKGPAAD